MAGTKSKVDMNEHKSKYVGWGGNPKLSLKIKLVGKYDIEELCVMNIFIIHRQSVTISVTVFSILTKND